MESEKTYFYPVLSDYDFGWFRLSGPGLANCMFVAARAYILQQAGKRRLYFPHLDQT